MYKGYITVIKDIVEDPKNAGKVLVTFVFNKDGVITSYQDSMSVVDPKIARDYIDKLEAPAEQAKAEKEKADADAKLLTDQMTYVKALVSNPPLGYLAL